MSTLEMSGEEWPILHQNLTPQQVVANLARYQGCQLVEPPFPYPLPKSLSAAASYRRMWHVVGPSSTFAMAVLVELP